MGGLDGQPFRNCRRTVRVVLQSPRAYRLKNVLQVLRTYVLEADIDLAADLTLRIFRDADATGLRNALKSRRNIHVIPKYVMRLDNYVADIDAHPQGNAIIFHLIDCKFLNAGLELHRSSNR